MKMARFLLSVLAMVGAASACGHGRFLPGTTIPMNAVNREIIDTIEE